MTSEEQAEEILRKKKLVIEVFLTDSVSSIGEVSEITGISESSVQRYLNDEEIILSYYNMDVYDAIKNKLSNSKSMGKVIGGSRTAESGTWQKGPDAKFTGSKRR